VPVCAGAAVVPLVTLENVAIDGAKIKANASPQPKEAGAHSRRRTQTPFERNEAKEESH
jgi:hypothetical protein